MANCEILPDETVIVSGIHGYHDIRIKRGQLNGAPVWTASTSHAGLGDSTAATRCEAAWKYFSRAIGNTEEAKKVYGEAATAIRTLFPEERPEEPRQK
jgi:hypothetical protein